MQRNELYGDSTMTSPLTAPATAPSKPSPHRGLLRGLLASGLALCAMAAQAAPQGFALRDGVVVDSTGATAYVMQPQGGIDALDLGRGVTLWHSDEGQRPLALANGLLVAQARPGERGELRVVALDVLKNGARNAEADLAMPAGIRADVAETLRQDFRVAASLSAQGIVLSWQAQKHPSLPGREGDAMEEEGESKGLRRGEQGFAQGTALFDPRAGSLLPLDAEAKRLAGEVPAVARSLSAPDAPERLFSSADGRHVLASRRTGDHAAPYRWTITDAATGAVLGSLSSRVSMSPFVVVGNRLIHVAQPTARREGSKVVDQPLRLRAVDLATGQELWSREIRSTDYRGPSPV